MDEFNHEKLKNIGDVLCDPSKFNIMLRAKSCEAETDQQEYWYGTKYNSRNFSPQLLERINNPRIDLGKKKLGLPPVNNLIPKNFDILDKSPEHSESPKLLKQWPNADLWYKKDDTFDRPKSVVSMKIYTKDCDLGSKPESSVFLNLWAHMQNEYLREFNYMANCANLSFNVSPMYDNVNFTWSGFNDSMPNYIDESISRLIDMKS